MMPENYRVVFEGMIAALFRDAFRFSLRDIGLARFVFRTVRGQRKAAKKRRRWIGRGVLVPPLMIVSVTDRCNLSCVGCYARALDRPLEAEMKTEVFRRIVREAGELGISIIMLAGGEPLMRRDIVEVTRDFPHIIFPLFTNGLLIDDAMLSAFKRQRNLVPVISLEGREETTDERRGRGIYDYLDEIIGKITGRNIFSGISFTVTNFNLHALTDDDFLRGLIGRGCRIFFFVEYVPVKAGTDGWVLTPREKRMLIEALERLRRNLPGLFIGFPGDEEAFGGCLAAGRGFVHVNARGGLEACPFAPYSDTDLKITSLRDGLQSPLLAKIRDHPEEMKEAAGGCALWARRDWVAGLKEKQT